MKREVKESSTDKKKEKKEELNKAAHAGVT